MMYLFAGYLLGTASFGVCAFVTRPGDRAWNAYNVTMELLCISLWPVFSVVVLLACLLDWPARIK